MKSPQHQMGRPQSKCSHQVPRSAAWRLPRKHPEPACPVPPGCRTHCNNQQSLQIATPSRVTWVVGWWVPRTSVRHMQSDLQQYVTRVICPAHLITTHNHINELHQPGLVCRLLGKGAAGGAGGHGDRQADCVQVPQQPQSAGQQLHITPSACIFCMNTLSTDVLEVHMTARAECMCRGCRSRRTPSSSCTSLHLHGQRVIKPVSSGT